MNAHQNGMKVERAEKALGSATHGNIVVEVGVW